MQELTQEYIKFLFNYENGKLYWKNKTSIKSSIKINDEAGNIEKHKYGRITINRRRYGIHCLIFLYHNGYYPKIIDHIDNNPLNNNINNLREVTSSQNGMNRKSNKNSSSQYKGVSWRKERKHWKINICVNGENKYLGSSKSETNAALIYNKAATKYFGEYAKLNEVNLGIIK